MKAEVKYNRKIPNVYMESLGPGIATMEDVKGYHIRYSNSSICEFLVILESEAYMLYKISDYSWIKFIFSNDEGERFEFEFVN